MSIPMILASKSQPRRDVLYAAGICPTIRVSHVDEPAALEKAAAERGVTVDQLNVEQRVMILAEAKSAGRASGVPRCRRRGRERDGRARDRVPLQARSFAAR